MVLPDHTCAHASNGNMSASSMPIYTCCYCQGDRNADPFDVSDIQQQLQEISLAAFPPKCKPMHQHILSQINTRLAQINTVNTVTGGAYDDVCKLYKDISFFAAKARYLEDQARNAVACHENLPIAGQPSEIRAWIERRDALEVDWILHTDIKEWAELAEDWVMEVSKNMDKLNAKVYPLQEKLSRQKKLIEDLHKKMKQAKCKIEMLAYELEACSIELEGDETANMVEEDGYLNMQLNTVPYLHHAFDVPHWTGEDDLGKIALEARKLYNIALDIELRVSL